MLFGDDMDVLSATRQLQKIPDWLEVRQTGTFQEASYVRQDSMRAGNVFAAVRSFFAIMVRVGHARPPHRARLYPDSRARVHNLKNISLAIPHNQLTVVTGVSGSGKSSLAFDTIYAEGQRRYVESLSAYARQFLERMEKAGGG